MLRIPTGKRYVAVFLAVWLWSAPARSQNQPTERKPDVSVRLRAERMRFRPGENVRLHVEIWNESAQDLFIFKSLDYVTLNDLASVDLKLYQGGKAFGPAMATASDTFASERYIYPPLSSELSRYWVAIPPGHFYGGELVLTASWFERLRIPGKYQIRGTYRSRGFLAQDINNPLLHYSQELKQLPYQAWVGEVETNPVLIEITNTR